ncbi:MAG: YraN family protein [Actinomycetota bacterium]
MAGNQRTGRRGEDAAAEWYRRRGFTVLDRNWRVRQGELDLICEQAGLVVFCEVKTRTGGRFGRGIEAVGHAKQRRIRQLAVRWLSGRGGGFADLRFDVAEVDAAGRVEVWEGCF